MQKEQNNGTTESERKNHTVRHSVADAVALLHSIENETKLWKKYSALNGVFSHVKFPG